MTSSFECPQLSSRTNPTLTNTDLPYSDNSNPVFLALAGSPPLTSTALSSNPAHESGASYRHDHAPRCDAVHTTTGSLTRGPSKWMKLTIHIEGLAHVHFHQAGCVWLGHDGCGDGIPCCNLLRFRVQVADWRPGASWAVNSAHFTQGLCS